MRIAFYYRNVHGGIKTHVEALSKEFERRGHEVKKINQFSLDSLMVGNHKGGISYGFDIALKKIRREIEGFDILHIHHAATFSEFLMPFSSICSEISVINTFHIQIGEGFEGELARVLIGTLASLYAGRSKKFISVARTIAEEIRRYCNNETETVVIPNGVDIERFKPRWELETAEEGAEEGCCGGRREEGEICIGYLGRLSHEKNVLNMVRAVKKLILEGKRINLRIAGTGPLLKRLKKAENERIRVLGYVEDAPSFYRSIDIFILPSKLEAQPITILEAMASGLPIIASDVSDNRYYVQGNGILCGTSAREIKEAIEEILKEDLERMGRLSREKAKNFTWDKVAEQTLDVYESVLR